MLGYLFQGKEMGVCPPCQQNSGEVERRPYRAMAQKITMTP